MCRSEDLHQSTLRDMQQTVLKWALITGAYNTSIDVLEKAIRKLGKIGQNEEYKLQKELNVSKINF